MNSGTRDVICVRVLSSVDSYELVGVFLYQYANAFCGCGLSKLWFVVVLLLYWVKNIPGTILCLVLYFCTIVMAMI